MARKEQPKRYAQTSVVYRAPGGAAQTKISLSRNTGGAHHRERSE